MTTALPAHVTLGPHVYEIRTDPESLLQLREDGSKGDSRPDRLVVRVDTDGPHTQVAETVLHEFLHCAWHQTPLSVDHDEDEEKIVTALAPRLLELLRSNPDLVKYLTS